MPAIDDGEMKVSLIASPPVSSDPAVKLYDNKIECVTCHDPHKPFNDTAAVHGAQQYGQRSMQGLSRCHPRRINRMVAKPARDRGQTSLMEAPNCHTPPSLPMLAYPVMPAITLRASGCYAPPRSPSAPPAMALPPT